MKKITMNLSFICAPKCRAIIASISLILSLGVISKPAYAEPFGCTSDSYLFKSAGDRSTPTTAVTVDLTTGIAIDLNNGNSFNATNINAIGYNMLDGYIWGYDRSTQEVVRVGKDFIVEKHSIAGLPSNAFHTGDVSPTGILFLAEQWISGGKIFKVDVNPASSNYLKYLGEVQLNPSSYSNFLNDKSIADFAFHPGDGKIYSVGNDERLYRINPDSGLVTDLGGIGVNLTSNTNAAWFDRNGNFYFVGNGNVYKIDISDTNNPNSNAVLFSTLQFTSEGDAARCAQADITNTAPALCFAMTDNVAELYSFDMDITTPPTKVVMNQIINGEGATYRAMDNSIYTFHQPLGAEDIDNPSDLYKVTLDGTTTLIKSDFLSNQGVGAEFVKYNDGSEHLITLVREHDSRIEIYDATTLTSNIPLKTIPLYFPDGSNADVAGLAINPYTGEILVVDDAADIEADHLLDFPEIYSVNMNTGRLTLKVRLNIAGIDAESLAFAENGNLYLESESWATPATHENRIFRVDLTTGDITPVEENINSVVTGDIEGMSCTGSKIITPPPPPPKVYDPKSCGVPGFLETFGSGVGRSPIPASSWSNYDYDEGSMDTNNGQIVMDDQYTVLDKSSIASAGAWWIVDDDHTGDANGRMLMVNADYFAGEFYRQSITGLTVGKEYSFAAHIANAEGDAAIRIPVNVKFSIESGGTEVAFVDTGNILQDPARSQLLWNKYELQFTATSTDIDIVLVNNTGGGMGNDLVIDDISISEICNVCTALTGEVTEVALPAVAQLKTTDKLFVPSKNISTSEGHLKAYPIDVNGTPSTTASWDANVMADRINRLYSSDVGGNKILFNSLDTAAFAPASAASIKAATIAANLGGVSKGNNLDILSNDINTSLYLSDTTYRSYYTTSVSSRSQRVLMSSDDGFLYAFDTSSGALVWAWMPRSLVSELASSASFQSKHLMSGSVDILDLPDSLGNYSTYIVGSYKSGLGHYVLKLAGNGDLSQVVWDDDQSASFMESPNNGEMEFFRDGTGLVYASYVLTDSTLTSRVKIRSLVDSSKNDDITLSYQASSTPFMMQDYGRSNAPAKKTLYVGTSLGAIHAAEVIDNSGNFNSVASIQLSLQGSSVTTMDDSNTDAVLYIDASVSAKDNKYYLSSQTATRLTIHRYKSSDSSWNKAWTSYSSGAGSWDDAGTYSADSSGVPADQGGFAIIPPSGIQSLPVDATVTDKAIIVGDTVILPLSVEDNSVGACYGKAYYYIYSLSDGKFPMGKVVMTDNTPVITNIALGYGDARQISVTNLAGTNKLIAYGLADKKVDLTSGIATTFVIKDPVTGGVRGWREIGR